MSMKAARHGVRSTALSLHQTLWNAHIFGCTPSWRVMEATFHRAFISANVLEAHSWLSSWDWDPWLTLWAIPYHHGRTDQDALHSAKPCNPVQHHWWGVARQGQGRATWAQVSWRYLENMSCFREANGSQKIVWNTKHHIPPIHINPWNPPSPRCLCLKSPRTTSSRLWFPHTIFDAGKTGGELLWMISDTNPLTIWFHSNYSPHVAVGNLFNKRCVSDHVWQSLNHVENTNYPGIPGYCTNVDAIPSRV